MKKALALLLALVMVLSLAACGGVERTPETTKAPSTEATDPTEQLLAVGDEVETENFRFTLKAAEFTDKILVCNGERVDKKHLAMPRNSLLLPINHSWMRMDM